MNLKKNCRCYAAGIDWQEMEPESLHRYRVQCGKCRAFMKWGSEAERRTLRISQTDVRVLPFEPPPTLDAFFVKDD